MSGLQTEAAVPKGNRAPEAPAAAPMRPGKSEPRRNPSTDQKKVRRQMAQSQQRTAGVDFGTPASGDHWGDVGREYGACKACQGQGRDYHNRPCAACGGSGETRTASLHTEGTVRDTWAEQLNPGDHIRLPNGKTQKVMRVRRHETDSQQRYVDTDGGTALVHRRDTFSVVPHNSQQQSSPGYGTPGGNSNTQPFSGGHGSGAGGTNEKGSGTTQCPSCGAKGTLARRGDKYACSRCGYQEQFGGAGNNTFTDRESIVRGQQTKQRPGGLNPFAASAVNRPETAIARRARAVLEQGGTP